MHSDKPDSLEFHQCFMKDDGFAQLIYYLISYVVVEQICLNHPQGKGLFSKALWKMRKKLMVREHFALSFFRKFTSFS